jgi:hypothetical protein
MESEQGDENRRFAPSPELRRYVEVLRRIERDPAEAPQTMAAMRSLERARRTRAAAMLDESRGRLRAASPQHSLHQHAPAQGQRREEDAGPHALKGGRPPQAFTPTPTAPPPIADVLRDLYEEEKKTA